jgi:hypothetical protein
MNVKIGTKEDAQFLFWEYINVIFVAVRKDWSSRSLCEGAESVVGVEPELGPVLRGQL